jgi:zinc transport system substrate-binding protein
MLNLQQLRIFCDVRKLFLVLAIIFFSSCSPGGTDTGGRIITVSIAPFKYFVRAIGGDDFTVNVMVPAGANPHIYEPFPKQIFNLRKSVGYISNGYLGFEITWLDRFYDTNRTMKKLSLNKDIEPLGSIHQHEGEHVEGADPHYWVSPKCALIMALSVRDFLCELNPAGRSEYDANYKELMVRIRELDEKAAGLFSGVNSRSFMIFHPNLGYLARDYGLEEIAVEYEGKEPPPSRMKELIDRARHDHIKTIFVQREYDTKNARAIANEIGADLEIIDPLSADWLVSTSEIIGSLYSSLSESSK